MVSIARLGCGDYNIFITEKCGRNRVCNLNNISSIEYNRIIDDISFARIVVATGGSEGSSCCRCLPNVEPWCHELHILRNGDEVWTGPIQRMTYGYETTTIEAADMLAWTTVRQLLTTLNFTTAVAPDGTVPLGAATMSTIAQTVLESAFIQGGTGRFDDPCFLDFIFTQSDDFEQQRLFTAFDQNIHEILQDLAQGGLNFTAAGRRVLLITQPDLVLAPIGTLQDEHIMGDIEIIKDGQNFATGWYTRWNGDDDGTTCTDQGAISVPCPGFAGFTDFDTFAENTATGLSVNPNTTAFCYPRVERQVDLGNIANLVTAQYMAQRYFEASFPVPRTLNIPPGTRLSPDTPFDINQLIPSISVNVISTRSCLEIGQAFRLQELTVNVDESGDEEIGVTLSDFNLSTTGI